MSSAIENSSHQLQNRSDGPAEYPQKRQGLVPYDENLLERARTQWQFGDWQSLAKLDRDTLQHHPERAKLILLAAAGRLQTDNPGEARQYLRLARDWGIEPKLLCQVIAAGVHNSLGRAAAISKQSQRAVSHFENSIKVSASGGDAKLLAQARIEKQLKQLGLPIMEDYWDISTSKPETRVMAKSVLPVWIQNALEYAPDAPPLLIAAAEAAQRSGDWSAAIRYWQRLAAVDGAFMQQTYYERLAQAYKQIKSFPKSSAEEEALRGDMDKHQVLKRIHQELQPRSYLEIGVQTGRSFFLATCPAIGVDPMPMISVGLPTTAKIIRTTSDIFFAEQAQSLIREPIDMVFIDGMHLFEYALRDFMNVEKYAQPSTLVLIDDIFPGHPAQAARDRRTQAWTGDVWKMLQILQLYRPDLTLLLLDVYPTGLLCISGLDRDNTVLHGSYEEIITKFSDEISVPEEIILRTGALSCGSKEFRQLLEKLHINREKN